jgi:thiamine-phosphate pyrophosphorylase
LPKASNINRIIDANINRAKEGLRVCEEISRFILTSRSLTVQLKKCRHKVDVFLKKLSPPNTLLRGRNSRKDIGFNIYVNELKRKNYRDILFANLQRVKESIRVLEEFSKLRDTRIAVGFKKLRYDIYELEKKIIRKISFVRCHR